MWTFGIWKSESTGKESFFKVVFNMAFANSTLNLLHIQWFCKKNPLYSVFQVIRQTEGQIEDILKREEEEKEIRNQYKNQ